VWVDLFSQLTTLFAVAEAVADELREKARALEDQATRLRDLADELRARRHDREADRLEDRTEVYHGAHYVNGVRVTERV